MSWPQGFCIINKLQGDWCPRDWTCPATADGRVRRAAPPVLRPLPTFSCSQHPLLSQRDLFVPSCSCLLVLSGDLWGQGAARHRTTPKAGGQQAWEGMGTTLPAISTLSFLCVFALFSPLLFLTFWTWVSSSVSSPELLSDLR